jgi:hypothetical protein
VGHLEQLARRVCDGVGWDTELCSNSGVLKKMMPLLKRLPKISIDHLGLSMEGLPYLLELVAHGAKVKATGFIVTEVMRQIVAIDPAALMFGTDLPSTRAPQPFQDEDLTLIRDNFPEEIADKVL